MTGGTRPWADDCRAYLSTHHRRAEAVGGPRGIAPLRQRHLLERSSLAARVDGFIAEVGVYRGTTLRYLAAVNPDRTAHGFDSFRGLSEDWEDRDDRESPGGIVPKGRFNRDSEPPDLSDAPTVRLWPGELVETVPAFLAEVPGPARLVHLDLDTYTPTRDVLVMLAEAGRIVPGTILHFDELLFYSGWRKHEWKALTDCAARFRWRWRLLWYLDPGYQAAVIIDQVGR